MDSVFLGRHKIHMDTTPYWMRKPSLHVRLREKFFFFFYRKEHIKNRILYTPHPLGI
jgi:hypothetical protein